MKSTLAVALSLVVGACSSGAAPAPAPAQAPSAAPAGTQPSFINKVWRVSEPSAVASGTLYVFLSDGTLLITSTRSKPALGTWTYARGALTMVEESIPYKVDILNLSNDEFRIRSNNPGGSVEIPLVPADHVPLPQ